MQQNGYFILTFILSEETKSLYNKIDEKCQITINGKGSLELVNISNFKVLARGKKR